MVDREGLQTRLRALFVDELAENVLILNRGLVALEQGTSDGTDALVHELFRAAHSLKGGAHSAGVPALVELCHCMEDALSRMRDGTLSTGTQVIEPLLGAVDALEAAGERLRRGDEPGGRDVDEARRRLTAVASAPGTAEPAPPPPSLADPVDGDGDGRPTEILPVQRDRGLRVPPERLESLLNQVGELLHAARRVDGMAERLRGAATSAAAQARGDGTASPGDAWRILSDELESLARATSDTSRRLGALGHGVVDGVRHARMVPLTNAYDGLERVVRDLSRAAGKPVELILRGGQVEVDRPVLDVVAEALLHLVKNAIDHGIEPADERAGAGKAPVARLRIEATLVQGGVSVAVADDGRGLDATALREAARRRGLDLAEREDDLGLGEIALAPGVSTAATITEVSGRGVGLDAVRARVESVGGGVRLESQPSRGCTVTLQLPLALSALRVLLVDVAGESLALPSSAVTRLVSVDRAALRPAAGGLAMLLDGRQVPVFPLADLLGFPSTNGSAPTPAVVCVLTGNPPNEAALVVDALLSEEEVVMKPLGESVGDVTGALGATILSSGRVALIMSPTACIRRGATRPVATAPSGPVVADRRKRVLLAEDTITTRALERSILESAGYDVLIAVDGLDAWRLLDEHGADAVISDVDMPRMNGVALCEAVRRSSRFANVPFILVTSLASDADRRRGLDAGASAYLVKADFDQELLLDTLERLL